MPKKTAAKPAPKLLDFESFVRAAMQTGKAPPAPKPKKTKKRKGGKK